MWIRYRDYEDEWVDSRYDMVRAWRSGSKVCYPKEDMEYERMEEMRKTNQREVRVLVEDFRAEVPERTKNQMRKRFLLVEEKRLREEVDSAFVFVDGMEGITEQWIRDMVLESRCVADLLKEIKRVQFSVETLGKPLRAGTVTDEDIRRAKEVDLIESGLIDGVKKGGRVAVLCLFHEDTSPSKVIYPGDRGFYCFACGEGGDGIKLIIKKEDISFLEAVRLLNKH